MVAAVDTLCRGFRSSRTAVLKASYGALVGGLERTFQFQCGLPRQDSNQAIEAGLL